MSRLADALHSRFGLVVSIPRNEAALALAAQAAGADAVKVHLNCHHRASGTTFRSWAEERSAILQIVQALTIPVGIVPGAEDAMAAPEEFADAGFDFWDLFAHHAPPEFFALPRLGRMVAFNYEANCYQMAQVEAQGMDMLEASIVHPDGYGRPLSAMDIARYRLVVRAVGCPVIIPTQRNIRPAEVQWLAAAGARGIAVGAVVTGHSAASLGEAVAAFRAAIDALPAMVHDASRL